MVGWGSRTLLAGALNLGVVVAGEVLKVMGVLVVCLGMLLGVVEDVLGMKVMELVDVSLGLLVGVVDDGLGLWVMGVLLLPKFTFPHVSPDDTCSFGFGALSSSHQVPN